MTKYLPKPWNDDLLGPELNGYGEIPEPPSRDGLLDLAIRFIALARRNWLLLLLFVGGAAGYTGYHIRSERPTYRARAVIQLRDRAGMLSSGIVGDNRDANGSDDMLSNIQVLRSRAVARAVVERLGLRLRPAPTNLAPIALDDVFVASDAPSGEVHLTFAATSVAATGIAHGQAHYGEPLDLGKVRFIVPAYPGVGSGELRISPVEDAVNEVLGSISAQPRDRTSILDVTVVSHDPRVAQNVANATVQVFQELTARNEKQESVRRREFIQQQLAKVEAQLSEAQLQYNRFVSHDEGKATPDQLKTRQSAISDIEQRKEQLESDQQTYMAMLDSIADPANASTFRERLSVLLGASGMSSNPLVETLYDQLAHYQAARDTVMVGPAALAATSPEVQRIDTLITSTREGLLRALSLQVAAMSARVNALEDMQQKFSQGLSSLPSLEVQQSMLQSQAETYRRQAEKLRDAFQTAQIEEAAQGGKVDIVDQALLPSAPIDSSKTPRLLFSMLLALGLGSTIAYILENRKDVIRRREELANVTPLPNLALVPRFRKLPASKRWALPLPFGFGGARTASTKPVAKSSALVPAPTQRVVTVVDVHSPGAEAYRTLRTNLLFSAAVQSLHRVIVTSAAPKEGKSTTAANLAAACAQQGQKVLLIDCDLRGPTVHTLFNRQRAPGLTNVLIGTVALDDALNQTNLPELSVLTAGTTPPNPAELLGSPKMAKLLDDLSARFDLVVIDTPPLLAASDAAILGRISDGTLVVIRAGQTQRVAVQEAIQQLHTVGARVLGTVLNDPDAEIAKFAPYYYQYYQSYYHARGRV